MFTQWLIFARLQKNVKRSSFKQIFYFEIKITHLVSKNYTAGNQRKIGFVDGIQVQFFP